MVNSRYSQFLPFLPNPLINRPESVPFRLNITLRIVVFYEKLAPSPCPGSGFLFILRGGEKRPLFRCFMRNWCICHPATPWVCTPPLHPGYTNHRTQHRTRRATRYLPRSQLAALTHHVAERTVSDGRVTNIEHGRVTNIEHGRVTNLWVRDTITFGPERL